LVDVKSAEAGDWAPSRYGRGEVNSDTADGSAAVRRAHQSRRSQTQEDRPPPASERWMGETMTVPAAAPDFGYGWGSGALLIEVARPRVRDAGELVDCHAIEQTVRAYGWAIDENRFDLLASLLSPQAEFSGQIAGVGALATVTGRDELVSWLRAFMVGRSDQLRHSMGNVLLTDVGAGRATALAYLTLHATTPEGTRPLATAFYRFTLSRVDDAWFVDRVFSGFDTSF